MRTTFPAGFELALPLPPREQIELAIETLLSVLDALDTPFEDLEDDDPAGDPLDERGEAPTDTGTEMLGTRPLYAVDQTRGPINEAVASRNHQVRELGLERTATGGWRFPTSL